MDKIKVLIKKPNEDPIITTIDNKYENLSNIVEGLIDMVCLPIDHNVDIICNDEFLYNGSKANIVMPEYESIIAGTFIMAGSDHSTGETISLTDDQINKCIKYCQRNRVTNMSLERAYQYSKIIKEYQEYEDKIHDYYQ